MRYVVAEREVGLTLRFRKRGVMPEILARRACWRNAAWYRDPWGVAPLRWWDGQNWTAFTSLGTWRPGVSGPGVWGPGGPGPGAGSSNGPQVYKRFDGPIWTLIRR